MKKLNGRLIVCALVAAAMASVSAVSVSAVDYGGGASPNTGTPSTTTVTGTTTTTTDNTGSTTTTTTTAGTSSDAPATVVTDKAVDEAVASATKSGSKEATLYMTEDANGKATVQEAAIAEIAKSKVTVTVEMASESGTDYSITIDPALITDAKAINLAMDITVDTDEGATVSGVEVPAGSIVIAPAQKGEFGMTLQVTIPAAAVADVDKSDVRLYYIADDGSVTKMPKSALKVNKDGSVTVSISHASQYVISAIDITKLISGTNNDEDDFLDDDDSFIDDDEDYAVDGDNESFGKTDDEPVVESDEFDANPGTGVTLALGALAASAAAVAITAKKRK